MTNERIEFDKRQWAIEQMTIAKICMIRASRACRDNDMFDVLYEIDELIEHEINEQKFMINSVDNINKIKFINHVLNDPDCEFCDDSINSLHNHFDDYYKMSPNDID